MKVLIVEDDENIQMTVSTLMEMNGHFPTVVGTGMKAIEYFKNHQPDVMLLDLGLPDMHGAEVYNMLAQIGKAPPTIVLSATWKLPIQLNQIKQVMFVAKPFSIEELEAALEKVTQK